MLAAALGTGCLIPPPLELEGSDGGPNRAPEILWNIIRPDVATDLTVYQTQPGKKKDAKDFNVGVFDPDPQTLYLNVFLDGIKDRYTKPIRSDQAPPTPTGNRSFIISGWEGLCDELVNYTTGPYHLEFYISDSGFLTEGEQREPKPGGQVRSILWRLQCALPPGSIDGGV